MRLNKLLSAALAAVLCVSMLGACGNSPSDTEETKSAFAVQPPAQPQSASDVYFSHGSGFYADDFDLEMNCGTEGAKIYYTTDGSVPDETDNLYMGAIPLTNKTTTPNILSNQTGTSAGGDYVPRGKVKKANVIRAVAVLPDGTKSSVLNGTFWIGIDREKEYGTVPVISIMTELDNLYDYEKGIYVLGKTYDDWIAAQEEAYEAWQAEGNYSNRGREWERPVAIEYVTYDGSAGFSQDMGIRIMGAASRSATQKSFRLTARADYGPKAVEYPIIPDTIRSDGTGEVTKYKSFVLRNGGNDCDFAKIRDPYLQKLADGGRYDTMNATPCVVYLNGEYWGMYTMAEDYSDNYIENNYGIDNKNIIIVKKDKIEDGNEEDIELYHEMHDFITSNDMTDPANYAKACEMIDMGSYIDCLALNLYIYNEDSIFEGNNWQMWRVRETSSDSPYADGKWRMLIYDTDYSTGIYNDGNNYTVDNISKVFEKSAAAEGISEDEEGNTVRSTAAMFWSLYQNEDFKRELVLSMCNMRNVNFEQKKALALFDEMSSVYRGLVPSTWDRFGPDWLTWDTAQYFNGELEQLRTFMDKRYLVFPGLMGSAMNLEKFSNVTVTASDPAKGTVMIGSTTLDLSEEFTGRYFPDYTLPVTAVPADGAAFKCWECTGAEISDPNSPTAEITFTGDFTLKAIFE